MKTEQKTTTRSVCAVRDAERQFLIKPRDHDFFVQTGNQLILACQLGISVQVWLGELEEMFSFVRTWSDREENTHKIDAVWATPRHTKTVIFVAPTHSGFDFDLADQLVDLHGDIFAKFNLGPVEVLQIPGNELARFVNPDVAVQIYGESV